MHIYTYVFTISALLHVLPAYPMLLSACKVQMARPVAPVAHSFRSISSDKQSRFPVSKAALHYVKRSDDVKLESVQQKEIKKSVNAFVDSSTLEDMEHFAGVVHASPLSQADLVFLKKLTVATEKQLQPEGAWRNQFIQYARMQTSLLQIEKLLKNISAQLPDTMKLSSLPLCQSTEKKIVHNHERAIKELTGELRTMIALGKSFNQTITAGKKAFDDERQRKRDEKINNSRLSEL